MCRGGFPEGQHGIIRERAQSSEWLTRWALRRAFHVHAPPPPAHILRTDASTTGMGAVLLNSSGARFVVGSRDDPGRCRALGMPTLTVLISCRAWGKRLASGSAIFRLQSDSRAALGATTHLPPPAPVLNRLAHEIALELEAWSLECNVGERYRGAIEALHDE